MKNVAATQGEPKSTERRDSIQSLYSEHGVYVHTLLLRLMGPGFRAEAEDLTQEVFVFAMKRLDAFDGRCARGWLNSIAVGLALNARRVHWLRERLFAAHLLAAPIASCSPEERVGEREEIALLYKLIDRLPPKQRMAFILLELHGLAPEEAAAALSCSIQTIYNHRLQARRELLSRYAKLRGKNEGTP